METEWRPTKMVSVSESSDMPALSCALLPFKTCQSFIDIIRSWSEAMFMEVRGMFRRREGLQYQAAATKKYVIFKSSLVYSLIASFDSGKRLISTSVSQKIYEYWASLTMQSFL